MTALEPTKKTRRPRKPDAEKINNKIDTFVAKVIDKQVVPYLQWCLDAAQAKTKYALRFNTGMGMICLYCYAPWQNGSWETPEQAGWDAHGKAAGVRDRYTAERILRLEEHFPELVQLFKTVFELEDDVPDLKPTVPPRADDGTRDFADYVEHGPLVGCQTPGCQYVSTEDDFILGPGDSRHCADCANGKGPHSG